MESGKRRAWSVERGAWSDPSSLRYAVTGERGEKSADLPLEILQSRNPDVSGLFHRVNADNTDKN